MADGYDRCILGFNTTTNRTQLISCKPEKFKVGNMHSEMHRRPSINPRTLNNLAAFSLQYVHYKKVSHFPVPSRDVANQNPGWGRENR
jgi:hypothetical protein